MMISCKLCILFLKVLLVFCLKNANGILNDTEYNLLPKVTEIDDFAQCQKQQSTHKYCVFDFELYPIPNVTSHVWELILEYRKDILNVRRDIIQRGHCIPFSNLSDTEEMERYTELYNRKFYDQGLQVRPQKMSCDYFQKNFDGLDIAAIVIFTILAINIFICTIIDVNTSHKKDTPVRFNSKLVQCFSLIKNWKKLGNVTYSERSMHYIQGFRFVVMSLLVYGHLIMAYMNTPMYNPSHFDMSFHRPSASILINGPVAIQMFILLSGFFLAINFHKLILNKKFRFKFILLAIVGRYFRLIVPFALVTLFSATLIYHVGSGAYWERNIGFERENCRQNWWANVILLSNQIKSEKLCMITSWYLATDFHLTLIGLVLFILIWQWKNKVKEILIVALIIACIIPGFLTYVYRLDPALPTYPEKLRLLFAGDKTYYFAYSKPYSNASAYILGILVAYFYCTGDIKKIPSRPKLFSTLIYIVGLTCSFGLMYASYIFYTDYYVYNQWISTVYAALYKLVWSSSIACVIWLANSVSKDRIDKKVMEWTPFVVLGRLSFSVYLTHWPVIRIIHSLHTIPAYYDYFQVIVIYYFSNMVLIHVIAGLFYLFVECPTSNILKLLIEPPPKEASPVQNKSNNNVLDEASTKEIKNDLNNGKIYCGNGV